MNLKEFNAVVQRPADSRYAYFIQKAASTEMLWGLYNEGWAMTEDAEDLPVLPLWPESEFAQHCAIGEWSGYSSRPLDLHAFMEKILPRLTQDGVKAAVFYNNSDSAIVEAGRLLQDLQAELHGKR
ncbi:DUF2750 domain-containing protein [Saccharibacillus sp. CPCC 101409]|uniref:DUF2750 domain-containing protein n=1 Tax=Saccharibacillus sp. CPCC 101409 TaxID=3058041 RepID=UPI0026716152|nr:DUF2750 domain-containing protein [Saccharibacillus sp. CPCC 101409]MDO3411261.1 DUF2750 domain-containing protein [Saccharibacillus sp. CPCC 101409]